MTEMFLTVEQVADRLQLHPDSVRRQLKRGVMRGTKRGTRWRVPESAIEESTPLELQRDYTRRYLAEVSAVYTLPFSITTEELPDINALFTPPTPEEIKRRLAALDCLGQQMGEEEKDSRHLDNADPTAGVRQGYNERVTRLMEGHR
jgi:excisionase family DNA binding protein